MAKKTNRKECRKEGLKFYQGYPCKNGHKGKRYVSHGQCAACYDAKLEALRKRQYGYRCNHPGYELLKEAKKRSKECGREFDIDLDDIIVPERCPISGRPFVKHTADAPSLDRIDNSKGYVKGNVMVISRRMNTAKSDLTAEEARRLADFMTLLS